MLTVSRPSARPIELTTIALDERLNAMRPLLERSLRVDILLDIAVPSDLPPVSTDPVQLELAVLNLCVNARDAMPKGGVITIGGRLSRDGAGVELTVADTGAGIAPEILGRIFEPYFTTKPMGQGTGLGLSQVYGFAQQSGGGVRVESEVGVGATVILTLPVSTGALTRAPDAASAPEPEQARDILVVEDDDDVAETVCAMLEDLGHRAIRAASAQQALDILSGNRRIDLVFSDIIMPGGMSGIDLARALLERAPDLPVLLTTGFSGTEDSDVGRPLLRKPYDMQALSTALAPLLRPASGLGHANVVALRSGNSQ